MEIGKIAPTKSREGISLVLFSEAQSVAFPLTGTRITASRTGEQVEETRVSECTTGAHSRGISDV